MNKFSVIIPVYNAGEKIARCLLSVLTQDYKNYDVYVIDDCSEDNTWGIIEDFGNYDFYSHRNKIHIGSATYNIRKTSRKGDKDDIIVVVDGDDYLDNNHVLSYLNTIYTPDVWLTYGQYIPLSGKFKDPCSPIDKIKIPDESGQIITVSATTKELRRNGYWVTSHLKTFRKWLYDKIREEDLKFEDVYFKTCCDVCIMYPMVEMAGSHIRFIDKVLYRYDDLTNNWGGNATENLRNFEYLKNKSIYDEL